MSSLNKPFIKVSYIDADAFKSKYINYTVEEYGESTKYSDKLAFIETANNTIELYTQGKKITGNEVYVGDPADAPADAKIIIDNTIDTSVEVYSKSEVDNKLSTLANDHTVFKREMTDTTAEIAPNTFYIWDEVTELTITLATPTDSTIYNEYMFQFTSGDTATTLSLPDGLTWYLDNDTILANKTYQVSIVNNLAVLGEF